MKAIAQKNILPLEMYNQLLVVVFVVLSIYQLFYLPLFMLNKKISLILSLVPLILLNNTFWSLIHEGIHAKLSANNKINNRLSRLLSICFCSPFRALQLAHLLHHKYNRTSLERNEMNKGKISYYFRLLMGVYVQELFVPFVVFLPRGLIERIVDKKLIPGSYNRIAVETFLKRERNLFETRVDLLCILAIFSLSFYCYGHAWWLLVLLLVMRAFCISFLDYSYHYGTKTDDVSFALNLGLPNFLSKWILHFNYHGTHHRFPLVPWHALPALFESENERFEKNFFVGAINQLKGPVSVNPNIKPDDIKQFVNQFYLERTVTTRDLQKVLQVKWLFLLSKEKQLCIAAELCNYLHSEADFAMAASHVGKSSAVFLFALHSFRRQKIANELFAAVKSEKIFSDRVKDAFGIKSQFHDETLRSAVTNKTLARKDAIFCCYNGFALNKLLGEKTITVPISFQTKDDIYVRNQTDFAAEEKSYVKFESIRAITYRNVRFKLKVSNAIELWRATTFLEKEPETVKWIANTIQHDSVFYDIGANIGIYSLFALAVHSDCSVVCFEPDSLNFARLTENIYLNSFGKRAIAFPMGLSNETKITRFHSSRFIVAKAENWCSEINERGESSADAAVITGCSLYSLDDFLKQQPELSVPTHLKIDVDGPEVKILKGATETLAKPQLKHILVELFEDEESEVIEFLENYNFKKIKMKSHTPIAGERGHMGNYIFRRS